MMLLVVAIFYFVVVQTMAFSVAVLQLQSLPPFAVSTNLAGDWALLLLFYLMVECPMQDFFLAAKSLQVMAFASLGLLLELTTIRRREEEAK